MWLLDGESFEQASAQVVPWGKVLVLWLLLVVLCVCVCQVSGGRLCTLVLSEEVRRLACLGTLSRCCRAIGFPS